MLATTLLNDLRGRAHAQLLVGYFARYKRDFCRDLPQSPVEFAAAFTRTLRRSPESDVLERWIREESLAMVAALPGGDRTLGELHQAVSRWAQSREIDAYAYVRQAVDGRRDGELG